MSVKSFQGNPNLLGLLTALQKGTKSLFIFFTCLFACFFFLFCLYVLKQNCSNNPSGWCFFHWKLFSSLKLLFYLYSSSKIIGIAVPVRPLIPFPYCNSCWNQFLFQIYTKSLTSSASIWIFHSKVQQDFCHFLFCVLAYILAIASLHFYLQSRNVLCLHATHIYQWIRKFFSLIAGKFHSPWKQ